MDKTEGEIRECEASSEGPGDSAHEPLKEEESSLPGEEEAQGMEETGSDTETEAPAEENPLYPEFEVEGSPKISSFFAAVRDVMLSPAEFFSLLTLKNGIGYPLAFGIVVYFINSLGDVAFALIEAGFGISFGLPDQMVASAFTAMAAPFISLFVAPIAILVIAIMYHVLLMLFKYDSAGFEGTLRIVCYASAPLVLGVIPFCGGIVGFFWSIFAMIIGLQTVGRMSTGWAILIYLIPLIFFCSCLGVVMGLGGLAAFMTVVPELRDLQQVLQEI